MSAVLLGLAAQINREHSSASEDAHSAVQHARNAGDLLLRAKQQMVHGQWLPWLRANCPEVSERTAQAYMRVARSCVDNPGRVEQLERLTLRGALSSLTTKPPNSAAVADFDFRLVTGFVVLGTFLRNSTTLAFILQESRVHGGYWHVLDLMEGTYTIRPAAAVAMPVALRFYPTAALCEWQKAPDTGADLFSELCSPSAIALADRVFDWRARQ